MSLLIAASLVAVVSAQIELRRNADLLPESARVTAVGPGGVTLAVASADGRGGTRAMMVGWEQVRAVTGDFAEPARAYADLADKAWRAHSRLLRGDPVSAEPLLEELFTQMQGQAGPTVSMVSEGLLRCRLGRGARMGAVDAWLALMASRTAAAATADRVDDAGLIDPGTGLAPELPPIWIGGASLQAWAAGAPRFDVNTTAGVLETLYRQAARSESGLAVIVAGPPDDPGARLVWEIVAARAGDADQRAAARIAIAGRLVAGIAPWQEAWCRVALGRSMLKEDSLETRRLGLVELLHVPARLGDVSPYLAGVALAEAAVELKREGDEAGAGRLRSELAGRFPDHAALRWDAIRGWAPAPVKPTAAAKPAEPDAKTDSTPAPAGPGGS